jgi:hypothetical protein
MMTLNQVVLEFLGPGLVVSMMLAFWLMLGLVLFKSLKDLRDFIVLCGLTIYSGSRWLAVNFWLGLVWLGRGIRIGALWIWQYLSVVWYWFIKTGKKAWKWVVKVSNSITKFFLKLWAIVVIKLKIAVQFSWWILAGVGIAIGETFYLLGKAIALVLWAVVNGLVIGFKWVMLPLYKFYKWLIIDHPLKPYRFQLNIVWKQTLLWFNQQWRKLIFKGSKTPGTKKPKAKVNAEKPKVVKSQVLIEDRIGISVIGDVNQAQVNKVKAALAREEALDDANASKEAKTFELRKIFLRNVKAKGDFYQNLTPVLKAEFKKLFIADDENRLIKEVSYLIDQNNDAFFDRIFNFLYRVRKTISHDLLNRMVDEGLRLADNDAASQTNIYEAGIRVAYARRSNTAFLKLAETLAKADVALHFDHLKTKKAYVYSVKRLAIILEKKAAFDEAIALVKQALANQLLDQTIGEYPERLQRLLAQKLILEAKNSGLFKESVEALVNVSSEDKGDEEDDTKTLDLSKKTLKKTNFYQSLNKELKAEFDGYFVNEGPNHLVKSLVFSPNGDNNSFFQNVFNQLYAYRKLISFELLSALYVELADQLEDEPELLTAINEATIKIMFYRRKEYEFLEQCETLCQQDIALHLDVLKTRSGFVYSFKRLAILLEKQGLYEDAIAMCDRAINLNLNDKTQGGYNGRKERIQKRQNQQVKVEA